MSIEDLAKKLAGQPQQPKRKVDSHLSGRDNRGMTKVEMLARALQGTVIEDNGYRGIIHVTEKNEYVRYHSTHGVHVVQRQPKTWRIVRQLLAPEEVVPFLQESGVLPKLTPLDKPLDSLAKAVGGKVIATFSSGGGVVKVGDVCVRFSNITGLDIVEFIVTKWRSVVHIADRNEVLRDLIEDPTRVADRLRGYTEQTPGTVAATAP